MAKFKIKGLKPFCGSKLTLNQLIGPTKWSLVPYMQERGLTEELELTRIEFDFKIKNTENGVLFKHYGELDVKYYGETELIGFELYCGEHCIEVLPDISRSFLDKMSFKTLKSWIVYHLEDAFKYPNPLIFYSVKGFGSELLSEDELDMSLDTESETETETDTESETDTETKTDSVSA